MADVLQIDDPRAAALARDLARETGESLGEAVNKALEERLARVAKDKSGEREKFVAEIARIADGATGLRKGRTSSRELVEGLYDEDGLPR